MARKIKVVGRDHTPGQALRWFWDWLTGNDYRPQRRYMRGGHQGGG